MKRGGIKRKAPLCSSSSLSRAGSMKRSAMKRRPTRARPEKQDEQYKSFIRRQSCCCGCGLGPPCDPAHENGGGMALKKHDNTCIPLRRACHRAYDTFAGRFKNWSNEDRKAFHDAQASRFRALYAAQTGRAA